MAAALGIALGAGAPPVLAQNLTCTLAEPCEDGAPCNAAPTSFRFAIDEAQMRAEETATEPGPVPFTIITMDERTVFAAEVLWMHGGRLRGFYEEAGALGTRMFLLREDGSATYSETPSGLRLAGTCMETGP